VLDITGSDHRALLTRVVVPWVLCAARRPCLKTALALMYQIASWGRRADKRADGRQLSATVASPHCCSADGNTIIRPSAGGQPQPSHELAHILQPRPASLTPAPAPRHGPSRSRPAPHRPSRSAWRPEATPSGPRPPAEHPELGAQYRDISGAVSAKVTATAQHASFSDRGSPTAGATITAGPTAPRDSPAKRAVATSSGPATCETKDSPPVITENTPLGTAMMVD